RPRRTTSRPFYPVLPKCSAGIVVGRASQLRKSVMGEVNYKEAIPTLKDEIEAETVEKVLALNVDNYKYGFETLIETDRAPKGLSEDVIRFISTKNDAPQWMPDRPLEAYRRW